MSNNQTVIAAIPIGPGANKEPKLYWSGVCWVAKISERMIANPHKDASDIEKAEGALGEMHGEGFTYQISV